MDVLSFRFQQETISDLHNTCPPFEKVYAARDRSREAKLTQIFSEVRSMGRRPDRRQTVRPELPACLLGHGLFACTLPCAACAKVTIEGQATIGFALVAAAPALAAIAALPPCRLATLASDMDETRS